MGLILNTPACEAGCEPCQMRCAILPARLAWWQDEIARAHVAGDEQAVACGVAAHTALTQRWADSPRTQRRSERLN